MFHKEPSVIRQGRKITTLAYKKGDEVIPPVIETFASISAAKRHSRHLQKAQGPMGNGYLRVKKGK